MLAFEKIDKLIKDIYALRQKGLAGGGEMDIDSLIFKEFRNRGYLDDLKDLKNELRSKELSLESLKEDYNKNNSEKLEFISELASCDWESGHILDPADFSEFKKLLAEGGFESTEEDFETYWDCIEVNRYSQFEEEKDESDPYFHEDFSNQELNEYRVKITQLTHEQPEINSNGIVRIYNVKEGIVNRIIALLRSLDFLTNITSTAGKFDFSKINYVTNMPSRYYTITARINK